MPAVLVGASGGLGRAFAARLLEDPRYDPVYCLSRSGRVPAHPKAVGLTADLTDEASLNEAAAAIAGEPGLVLVASGVLSAGASPEKAVKQLEAETLHHLFAVNAAGPALVAKHLAPRLPKDRRAVFAAVSAKVGSIEDNRIGGWMSYRASKAALNMLMRCLAIELKRSHKQAICAALHPGTVDTALSAPFQRGVKPEKLFTPDYSAQCLLSVLDGLGPPDSGGFFAWDGERLPF